MSTRKDERQSRPLRGELPASISADDEGYEQMLAEQDLEFDRREAEMDRAEQPLTGDLRAAGLDVDSVWDLGPWSLAPYPEALPVLIEHLERGGYPDLTTTRIGNALAVRPSVVYWDRLRALYLAPRSEVEEDAVAIALAGCAGPAQLDDLLGFLDLEERGESRIFFLRPIRRLGRRKVQALLEQLQSHPVLGTEATAILRGRSRED